MTRPRERQSPVRRKIYLRSRDRSAMKLRDIGEDRLLGQLFSRLSLGKEVVNGLGDDCAVVETRGHRNLLVLKTDCVVAGMHFLPTANALHVGWKAMMRPLSDFAATSALPQFALITLIAPEKTKVEWVERLYRGLSRAAKRFKVSIVGGEMSGTPGPVAISVSVVGFVERNRCVSRRGGKAGDDLFVTGRLGGALKQKHLQFVPRIVESRWLTRNFPIHAMMDLSDGLGADLPRLAKASRVGFAIEMENLPVARGAKIDDAISEGEDYELLFAISRRERNRLLRSWNKKFPKIVAHSYRLLLSTLNQKPSTSPSWLHSFPTARLRLKQPDADLRRMQEWDRFWLCRANWEAAKLCSLKASWPAWEATLPFSARPLRLCTNIEMGVCLFITSIFFVWRIASPSRGLASMTIFLATEFR